MADRKATPDESAAEKIASAIEGQLYRLNEERTTLLAAATRIADIDAEVTVLQSELDKITGRRKPKAAIIP